MSIQLAAKHLAAHGRGPDTTLVHMTPGEVASLQSLAQQHGGSLTTNPHTGLPEAGFLSALLPMAAGAGLAAMGMPAGYAALAVGATSAATNGGDLRKGLMNGISAYGGAGMAESFMGAGAAATMGTSTTAAPATTLATPPGATSPYALTGSSATPSTASYSLGEPSGFGNKALPSLVSTAPAEAAQAAAAATPAAQAAQQAASLDTMNMGQRWDALKAGASGTNAMNYIKANPLTSLGVASAMLTPDENKTPQKAADTDRGPRAGLTYHPGWINPMPKPNMQGVEQPFNRPYYAAKGGVTRMASGGITSAPRNQQQLFADYLQRVSSSGATANGTTPPTNKYDWWKNQNDTPPTAPAPTETAEEYAARMRLNARGGGGGRTPAESSDNGWQEPTSQQAYNWSQAGKNLGVISPLIGGVVGAYGNYLARNVDPNYSHEARHSINTPTEPAGYTSSQFSASPPPEGYTSEQFSATPSTGYTSAQFSDKSLAPTTKGDPFAGYFNSDPTLNQIAKYADPSTQPAGFFPAGTAYTDKQFFRDSYGNLFAPGNSIPAGTTASGNMALADQNRLQGLAEQRALDSQAKSALAQTNAALAGSPVAPMPYSAGDEADRTFAAPDAATIQANYGTAQGFAQQRGIAANPMSPQNPDKALREAMYKVNPRVTMREQAQQEAIDNLTSDNFYAAKPDVTPESLQQTDAATNARLLGLNPAEVANEQAANFQMGAPMRAETARLAKEAEARAKEAADRDAARIENTPMLKEWKAWLEKHQEDAPQPVSLTPDIVGTESEISADVNPDKTAQDLGVPSVNAFNSMYGVPFAQTALVNNGVTSDAGNSLGYVTPDMGNNRSAMSVPGFGTNVWRSADGTPIRTGDGSSLQTGNAAEAQRQQDAVDRQVLTEARQNNPDPNPGHDIAGEGGYSNSMTTWGGGGGSEAADGGLSTPYGFQHMAHGGNVHGAMRPPASFFQNGKYNFHPPQMYADGGLPNPYDLGSYSDGGRLLKGPGDGVSDSIPATIGKGRPARLADGEFVIPARIVSEIGNGSTDAGARKLYAMMDRIQAGRKKSVGKGRVAVNSRADKYLPA